MKTKKIRRRLENVLIFNSCRIQETKKIENRKIVISNNKKNIGFPAGCETEEQWELWMKNPGSGNVPYSRYICCQKK